MPTFQNRERLVSTRNGMFLVVSRELTGAWEIAAVTIRALLIGTGSVLIVVVSALVSEEMEPKMGLLGVALCMLGLLSLVPWRVVATRILGRRFEFIAGKATRPETITAITLMDH